MLSFPQGMNFLCTLLMDLFHGDLQLKNLRKVTRELGENITDEQLEAMIDECRPLKLLEYCPLFYQYYCDTRSNQGSVLWQIQAQITVWREKNLLMTEIDLCLLVQLTRTEMVQVRAPSSLILLSHTHPWISLLFVFYATSSNCKWQNQKSSPASRLPPLVPNLQPNLFLMPLFSFFLAVSKLEFFNIMKKTDPDQ